LPAHREPRLLRADRRPVGLQDDSSIGGAPARADAAASGLSSRSEGGAVAALGA
jgi:hypothetical protein